MSKIGIDYDVTTDVVIDSPPDKVWSALIAEFNGAAKWWVPTNTFKPGAIPPEEVGGRVEVTVHPKGVDGGGPKLRFVARTRSVLRNGELVADYVSGVFRGTSSYFLTPVNAGRQTLLTMHFKARPHGWVRRLARVADIGQEHLTTTEAAFVRLGDLLSGARLARTGRQPAPVEFAGRVTQRTITTDDGATLAMTSYEPRASFVEPDGPDSPRPTVVLCHGWGAGRPVWDSVVCRLLDGGYPVVTYDQRGHGSSTVGKEAVTIDRFGRDLATVTDHVAWRDLIIVGHSGGGFGAMAYASGGRTERLRGLVLLGTAAHDQYVGDGEARMMGNPIFSWALRRRRLGRKMLRHTMGTYLEPGSLETNRVMFAATPRRVRASSFRASKGMDLRAGLASVNVPTIVLSGARDKVVKPALGEAIAAAIPNARYEVLAEVGHMIPLEVPHLVVAAIDDVSQVVYQPC